MSIKILTDGVLKQTIELFQFPKLNFDSTKIFYNVIKKSRNCHVNILYKNSFFK